MKRKTSLIVLAILLMPILTVSCTSMYDATLDVNHDGTIDILDISKIAKAYGSSGTYWSETQDFIDDYQELLAQNQNLTAQLNETRRLLNQTETELALTQTELEETQRLLNQTKIELNQTQETLAQTQENLTLALQQIDGLQTDLGKVKIPLTFFLKSLSTTTLTIDGCSVTDDFTNPFEEYNRLYNCTIIVEWATKDGFKLEQSKNLGTLGFTSVLQFDLTNLFQYTVIDQNTHSDLRRGYVGHFELLCPSCRIIDILAYGYVIPQ